MKLSLKVPTRGENTRQQQSTFWNIEEIKNVQEHLIYLEQTYKRDDNILFSEKVEKLLDKEGQQSLAFYEKWLY